MTGSSARVRGGVVGLAVSLLAGLALAGPTAPAGADTRADGGLATNTTIAGGASATAGGFGLPRGSLSGSVQAGVSAEDGYDTVGNCAGYATNVGVGVACFSGDTGVPLPSLDEQFPGRDYAECRYFDIPVGMQAPKNKPGPGQYYLRACIPHESIDWDDPFGGTPQVTLGFDFVREGAPDPTEWNPTPLDEFLWDIVSQNYPTPFATNWPFKIPRVNAPTWFEFRWLNEDLETAAQGPYAGNENGGPYLELQSSGVTMTAEAERVRIAPQIRDPETGRLVDKIGCDVPLAPYDQDADPTPDAQQSDCYVVFQHSSAAAEELTPDDVPLPPRDPDYPIPMYVIDVEVDWHVEMSAGDERASLGTHTYVAHQALPVSEVSGLVGPEV